MFYLLYIMLFILLLFSWKLHIKFSIKTNKRFILFYIFLLALLMANRGVTIHDTQNYINIYERVTYDMITHFSLLEKYLGVEYGFILLICIFKKLGIGVRIFFFSIAFFNCFVTIDTLTEIAWFWIEKKKDKISVMYLTLILYIAGFGMLYTGIAIRGGLSIALCLFSMKLVICDQKKIKAFILGIIAFSMHRMAINLVFMLCIIYFVKVNNVKLQLGILFSEALLFFSGITIPVMYFITNKMLFFNFTLGINGYSSFINGLDTQIGKIDIYILLVCFLIISLTRSYEGMSQAKNIILAGGLILTFGYGIRALSRIYDYYMIMQIPLLAGSYDKIKINKFNLLLFYCLIIGNLIVMFSICS